MANNNNRKSGLLGGNPEPPKKLKMDRSVPQKIAENIRNVEEKERQEREGKNIKEEVTKKTSISTDKRGAVRLNKEQKEYWNALKTVSRLNYDYELAEKLMQHYVATNLTQEEKAYLELLLKFKKV